jgi:hypothetical protein
MGLTSASQYREGRNDGQVLFWAATPRQYPVQPWLETPVEVSLRDYASRHLIRK